MMLILPLISCVIGTADYIHSHVNLDLSKFYYFTKVIENKSHLTVTKLFKTYQHTSDEITLQNILAFARANNYHRIEIPRSIIDYPMINLNHDNLNTTKIIIKDPKWDHYVVAYPINITAVNELNIDEESGYFDAINSHTNLEMYRIFAVKKDYTIIGGCQLNHDYLQKDRAVIEMIYVSSTNRNNGASTHLIEAAKELSQAYSKNSIKLFAFAYGKDAMKNQDLIKWYTKHGFSTEPGKQCNMSASVLTQASPQQSVVLEFDYSL